jgi:hypothetical protein
VGSPSIIYQPRENTIAETERVQLVAVYGFILDCHARKEGAHPGAPDDFKESREHAVTPTHSR